MTTSTATPKFLVRAYIQGKLMCLRGESIIAETIRHRAVNDLSGCIKMIKEQIISIRGAEDKAGKELLERIIGEQLLKDIEAL